MASPFFATSCGKSTPVDSLTLSSCFILHSVDELILLLATPNWKSRVFDFDLIPLRALSPPRIHESRFQALTCALD